MFSCKYTKSCLIIFKSCIVFHHMVVHFLCHKFSTEGFLVFFFPLMFCYYKRKKKVMQRASAKVVLQWTYRNSPWVLKVGAENIYILRWNKDKKYSMLSFVKMFRHNFQILQNHCYLHPYPNWTNFLNHGET